MHKFRGLGFFFSKINGVAQRISLKPYKWLKCPCLEVNFWTHLVSCCPYDFTQKMTKRVYPKIKIQTLLFAEKIACIFAGKNKL